ncbi:MAG: DUF3999 family protein [candidate division NC10 bacterium]|nr:DUF3999 family protein [candidate division NC10 bacterium]
MRLRRRKTDRRPVSEWWAAGGMDLLPTRCRDGRNPAGGTALFWCAVLCLAFVAPAGAGTFPAWEYRQEISLPAAGLIKLALPAETLDAASPGLEDLRILDPAGGEVPYLIERGSPTVAVARAAKSLRVSLGATSTVLTIETGLTDPLDGMTVTTPAETFIKAVQVEGSADGKRWRMLAQGLPIFRQPNGVSQLHVPFPAGAWPFLRVTVDDQRSPPVPFTDARLQVAARDPVPGIPVEVRTAERIESPGETRLTLHLGAAHLRLAAVQIDSPEPLFTRRVSLAARQVHGDTILEKTLAEGVVFRIALPGRPPSSQLTVPVELTTPSRELLLLIRNEDSPPLQISALRAERRPVYVIFMVGHGGPHVLLTGNRLAPAPRYDLASLGLDFRAAEATSQRPSALGPNPDYRPAAVLPPSAATGPALDVSAWTYRKRVQTTGAGVQELEFDLDVLSHALASFADLRLMSNGQQLPYILEQTSMARALVPEVAPANDSRTPKLSRWALKLPRRNLPIARLVCSATAPLFRREVLLYEEATDERGGKFRRQLGRARWVRTPEQRSKELLLPLTSAPTTETLLLEAYDGDNPPIALENCQAFYPVRRLHFQAAPEAYLYYGNRRAEAPRYDLGLISAQILRVERAEASLTAEEQVGRTGWPERLPLVWQGGILLWGTLAAVVLVLLLIISRLLPRPPPPAGK